MKLCRLMLGLALCLALCACAPEPGPAAGEPDPKSAVGQEQPEEPPVQPVSPEKPMPEEEGEEIAPAPEEDTGILPPSEENPSNWAPSEPEERIDPWAIQEKRSLNVHVVDEDGNPSPNIAVTVRDTFAETEGIDVVDVWIGVSLTDATGYVNRPFKDLPVMPICITLENRSIPASDPLRFQEHYYTAEEFGRRSGGALGTCKISRVLPPVRGACEPGVSVYGGELFRIFHLRRGLRGYIRSGGRTLCGGDKKPRLCRRLQHETASHLHSPFDIHGNERHGSRQFSAHRRPCFRAPFMFNIIQT